MVVLGRAALQGGLALGLVAFAQGFAHAETRFFTFSQPINGAAPSAPSSGGVPPWLTATISDLGGGGGVTIKFESKLLGNEFIDNVAFNLNDDLYNPSRLAVGCIAGACNGFSSQYSKNGFSVVSGGQSAGGKVSGFDIGFLFGNNQLKGGSSATIKLTGAGLTAAEFDAYSNTPGKPAWIGDLRAAAKVKNIGKGGDSGEISGTDPGPPPPDSAPGPLPILGAVAAFQASRRLRRRLLPVPVAAG